MKVWKMVFLQVVTTTPAPAQWNFLHFIIASFQTLPQSLFSGRFRSRDRIGEEVGWGKTCPKDYESLSFKKKMHLFKMQIPASSNCDPFDFPNLEVTKFRPEKVTYYGFTFRGLLGNLPNLGPRNSAWRSCAPGKLQLLEEISKSESLENATWKSR